MTPETIRFTSQTDELPVAVDLARKSYENKRLMLPTAIFSSLVFLGLGISYLFGSQGTLWHIVGSISLIYGFSYVPIFLYRRRFVANEAKGGITYEFTINEQGIEAVVPKPFSVA
jgi:hypothetical protein